MKYLNSAYSGQTQKNIERVVLLIYLVYDICMCMVAVASGWASAIPAMMLMGAVFSIFAYLVQVKNYKFRAILTTIMTQFTIALYAMNQESLFTVLSTCIALVILIGFYGIKELQLIPTVTVTFLFLWHGFVLNTIHSEGGEVDTKRLMQAFSVYFIIYVVYLMVKKQQEGNVTLLQTINELKAAQQSKDDFLANLSHEIRTPINTIYGFSEVIQKQEMSEILKEEIKNIQNASINLMSVVSDILDFSELQFGKMNIAEENYNITSTINDVINTILAKHNMKNIELIIDCDATLPSGMIGDEQKLRRVIMNLVNNAIKFTDDGFVSIEIGYRKEAYGVNLIVNVKDSGIGMEKESIEKLFTSFNQVDTKRTRQEGGIGLGMAISQAIIDRMGGFINVKSKFGRGTEIQFAIPQKVSDETPIVQILNTDGLLVGIYINMEQFEMTEIRDEYSKNIKHLVQQLKSKCHLCRNLNELKRRHDWQKFSHVFISMAEYQEDRAYFDDMALHTKLILIVDDRREEQEVQNVAIHCLRKPFYVVPIAALLNGKDDKIFDSISYHKEKFIAPEAHVLVVDDNEMNIKVMDGLLSQYKIQVSMATSGREALKKIESKEFDFVFMDHMMPEMDGIETLQRIRQKAGSYYKNVPIIALTANAVGGTREMFLESGFNDFVSKPVEMSVLNRVLKRTLPAWKIILEKDIDKVMFESKEEKILLPEGLQSQSSVSENMQETQNAAKDFSDEDVTMQKTSVAEFRIGDLDVNKGMLYCGGKEKYIEILQIYVRTGETIKEQIQTYFDTKDWKNYIITVHGIKSSMLSIGAVYLSELAKSLEMEGKAGNEAYIYENHAQMVKEYLKVLNDLKQSPFLISKQKDEMVDMAIPVLEDEKFEKLFSEFEESVYVLESDRMLEILKELSNYQYHGKQLREEMYAIEKKVDMSDYMSALEVLSKLREKLNNT